MTANPGQLERTLGGPPVDVVLAGQPVPAAAVGPITVRRWRTDPDQRPDAAVLSLTVATDLLALAPVMGSPVTVRLSAAATAYFGAAAGASWRFKGAVSDLAATPASKRQAQAQLVIVAVGTRANLGHLDVGDVPWPQELDGSRAGRILDAAVARRPELVKGLVDPGTVTVNPRDVDKRDAQGLLDELALDTGGELVELRDGSLAWQDAIARQNAVTLASLAPGNVLAPARMVQSLEGMVNRLELGYGTDSPQAQAVAEDATAAATFGTLDATQGTQLALAADAQTRANEIVGRRSRPLWRMDALAVDLTRTVDKPTAAALLAATFGSLVGLTGLPRSLPIVTLRAFVEGMTETITRDRWTLQLNVSDKALTGAPPRWVDVPGTAGTSRAVRWDWPTRTWVTYASTAGPSWAELDPTMTWLAAVAWDVGDAETDRWADAPASTRWDQVPGTVTWATYTAA